jgi:long-chain acyl-CoA synthetase
MLIEQALVLGSERKFVSALLVPSFPNLKDWCRRNQVPYTTDAEMINHPAVLDHYKDLIEAFNKFFNQVEQVKKFTLLEKDWSVDSGELTPKLSLKRKVIMEKFKDQVEEMYR